MSKKKHLTITPELEGIICACCNPLWNLDYILWLLDFVSKFLFQVDFVSTRFEVQSLNEWFLTISLFL